MESIREQVRNLFRRGRHGRLTLRGYGAFALYGRPLPLRIAAVMAPMTVVAVAFGWLTVVNAVDLARPLDEAERYAEVSTASLTLVEKLQDERDRAARAVQVDRDELDLDTAFAATEDAIEAFETALAEVPESAFGTQVAQARASFAELGALRDSAFRPRLSPLATIDAYSKAILPVIHVGSGADSQAVRLSRSPAVVARTAGLYDLVLAAGAASQRRALVTAMLSRDWAEAGERDALVVSGFQSRVELDAFQAIAGAPARTLFEQARVALATRTEDAYVRRVLGNEDGYADAGLSVAAWLDISNQQLARLRLVIGESARGGLDQIRDLRISAWQAAAGNTALFAAAAAFAVIIALAVGGGVVRDLRRLRRGMLKVANDRLPRTVRSLSEYPPELVDLTIRPVGGDTRDEIGQVADAFDTVHREAVRLAAAQARMRTTTNAVIGTVAGRAQKLVGEQLAVISELERDQIDPIKLDGLFRLDHLATRMRRYGEVLLVLADDDPGRRRTEPALLVDVVQAAVGEIEQYVRVELLYLPAVSVAPALVVDLAHLLAELLDNAVAYSDPGSVVHVFASRQRDGQVLIEIHDDGPGMPAETLDQLNTRLTGAPGLLLGKEPQLGLFIVRLLAARHGVRARLSTGEQRGTVASVLLPASLVAPAPSASAYELPEPIGFGPQTRV
jgi:signal transduction histidine kinase